MLGWCSSHWHLLCGCGICCAGAVYVMQCGVCCVGVVFVCAGCTGVLAFIIWVWHAGAVFVVVASVMVVSIVVASIMVVSVVVASVVVSVVTVSVIVMFVVLVLCSWWCLPLVLMAHITISNTVKLNVSNLFGMCSMHLLCFCEFVKP